MSQGDGLEPLVGTERRKYLKYESLQIVYDNVGAESDFYIEMTFLKMSYCAGSLLQKCGKWCREGGPQSRKVIVLLVQLFVDPEGEKKR